MPADARRIPFRPKLITVLREGYGLDRLRRDAFAGLTVAIVALPLAMALAIASGASPDKGLTTAIVAGFLISALVQTQPLEMLSHLSLGASRSHIIYCDGFADALRIAAAIAAAPIEPKGRTIS